MFLLWTYTINEQYTSATLWCEPLVHLGDPFSLIEKTEKIEKNEK